MSEAYDYRVKFKDIRVKPPADETSRARAQETKVCEHKGCDLAGDYKSPKHDGGEHHFCQRHAAEYNKKWNFFDGMTEEEVKELIGKPSAVKNDEMLGLSSTIYTYTKGNTEAKVGFINGKVTHKSGKFE